MEVYCGIDWAEQHHDVAVVDLAGRVLAQQRIGDDLAGFSTLIKLLDRLASTRGQVGIALETDRGLFVHALRQVGYRVFAINPMAVDRYRDRYRVSRAKSDSADALVLANLLRTDADRHREIPADSEQAVVVFGACSGPARRRPGAAPPDRAAAVAGAGVLPGRAGRRCQSTAPSSVPGSDEEVGRTAS